MTTGAPGLIEDIDLAMYELEQPAPPCFVRECPTEASWYAIFPHDAPCSIEPICDPHRLVLVQMLAFWMRFGTRFASCCDCRGLVEIAAIRFEAIER